MTNDSSKEQYLSVLENFITRMEAIQPMTDYRCMEDAVREICVNLRIAELEYNLIDNPNIPHNSAAGGRELKVYGTEDADKNHPFVFTRITGEGNRIEYYAYPISGNPEWTEEEKTHINAFITILFIFNSRARVMNIAERLKFRDSEFVMYNMNYFMKTAGEMLDQNTIEGLVLCRFNVRNMGVLNRQFGMQGGSQALRRFVKGLESLVDEPGFVCRMGGDNFVLLFPQAVRPRVQHYLSGTTVTIEQKSITQIHMSATAGYYLVTKNNKSPHDLMRKVSVAYEYARQNKGLSYAVYDEQTKQEDENKKWVESRFDASLNKEEFLVYYQPKVNLQNNMMSGAEALCRWYHEGELILPGRFIPILEQSGNICALDFYVLEHVCRDIRKWMDSGLSVVRVSVNFSRVHLGNENLVDEIFKIVDRYQVPHEYIEIELTETMTDVNFNELRRVVEKLHNAGFMTAVDDFGVGFSSLNLIRDLPWNVLKIDKSFLPDETDLNRESKQILLKHVVKIAQDLGLECIAEGTETREQVELLRKTECYSTQGFYFDKPLPKEQFEERLRNPQYT